MTEQEQAIMAELKAACQTCVNCITGILEVTDAMLKPQGPWINIRAARHLARRAVAMANEHLTTDEVMDFAAIAEIGAE
jgi:hypothetical protein